MKNKFGKLMTASLLISGITLFTSCEENKKAENEEKDPKEVAEDHNDAKFNKNKEKDAQLLVDAAEMSLKEIKVGELAQKTAVSAEVKKMGQKMATEHKKSLDEISKIAEKKMITVPKETSEESEKDYKSLMEKTGKEFDKHYCDMMVDDHKDAVDKFEKASTDSEDYEIKSMAGKMLPTLRTHLDEFMTLQEKEKEKDKDNTSAKDKNTTTDKK
jgi:putative membrane protein